jgi:hypothetical protein
MDGGLQIGEVTKSPGVSTETITWYEDWPKISRIKN